MSYIDHLREPPTQHDRVDPRQAENSAGGYSFLVGRWERLERFLILGTTGGSYYASERKLTRDSAQVVTECFDESALRAVRTIVEISQWGRAPKQSPAILALAIGAAHREPVARSLSLEALPLVCRTGSTLMEFLEAVDALRGWGHGLQRAVGRWYTEKEPDALAYQVLKYRRRRQWSHADILRKAHVDHELLPPKSRALVRWVVGGRKSLEGRLVESVTRDGVMLRREEQPPVGEPPALVEAFERIQALTGSDGDSVRLACDLIIEHKLPHEMVPDHFKASPLIWEALFDHMPPGALVRNLGKLSAVGLLTEDSSASRIVAARLDRLDFIRRGRLHPMTFLCAESVYRKGKGQRGKLTWTPVKAVCHALEQSFYLAFGNVEPSNQHLRLCLDVSASMAMKHVSGVPGMSPRRASCALALVTLRVEPNARVMAFGHELVPIEVGPDTTLEQVEDMTDSIPFGGTDCSLPIRQAIDEKLYVEGFAVYTDDETRWSAEHPHLALRRYRQELGVPARLAVVSMLANGFSIADPNDAGMLDLVGFDVKTPSVVSEFLRGKRRPRPVEELEGDAD